MMRRILILFISIFTLTPTFAQKQAKIEKWFDQGLEFHEQGNYTEAVKWYRKAAKKGDATAQYILGLCYYNGDGVPQDYTEAAKWYRKAAEQGLAQAQFNLGGCYYDGDGVPKNKAVGIKWMKKAAQQGDEYAKNYLEGLGETW
jgi:TPR repeat protein